MSQDCLFTPLRLGHYQLSNRIVMPPMTRSRASQPGDVANALMADYYAQRASAGLIISAGTESPYSLYSENIATFGESDYDQKDSAGFINLFGLPIKVKALMEQGQLNK